MLVETSMPPVFNVQKCTTRSELFRAVREAMESHGNNCDLNHLDVSVITDFRSIFQHLPFCGNISRWNVSNATTLERMFEGCAFNGDLAPWGVKKVKSFARIFHDSNFTGNLSAWQVQKGSILSESLNEKQMALMETTVFHWYMADSKPECLTPIQRHHWNALAPIAQGMGLTKEDTALWLQEQWLEKSAPALSYKLPDMVLG